MYDVGRRSGTTSNSNNIWVSEGQAWLRSVLRLGIATLLGAVLPSRQSRDVVSGRARYEITCIVWRRATCPVAACRNGAQINIRPFFFTRCAVLPPPSYARDGANVTLRGISLFDNAVARGSVVFIVNSELQTYQVRTK